VRETLHVLHESRTAQAELHSLRLQWRSTCDPLQPVPYVGVSPVGPLSSNASLGESNSPLLFDYLPLDTTKHGVYHSHEASTSNGSFSAPSQSPISFSPFPFMGNTTSTPPTAAHFGGMVFNQQAPVNTVQTMSSMERSTLYTHPQASLSESSVFSGTAPYQHHSITQALYENDLATFSMSSVNSSSPIHDKTGMQHINESLASLFGSMDDTHSMSPPAPPAIAYEPPITVVLEEASPPSESEMDVEESPIPIMEETTYDRFPGQRTEANVTVLDRAFSSDPVRRTILSRIRGSTWLKSHLLEPTFGAQDGVTHGLDLSGLGLKKKESVYRAFLEDGTGGCLFPSVDGRKGGRCGKKEKRPLRALAHIRGHLGHRPFVCDGCYKCDKRDEWVASGGARYLTYTPTERQGSLVTIYYKSTKRPTNTGGSAHSGKGSPL
jgi:hypothetical protein